MLALALWRATRCPSCGRNVDECTAAANEGRYSAGLPHRCHATTALLQAQERYAEAQQPAALMWRITKRR